MHPDAERYGVESAHAWMRLVVSLAIMTIGGVGMYGAAVVLPAMQADFAAVRGDASLPYTLTLMGFGVGGIMMGRVADRWGVLVAVVVGAIGLGLGFVAAASVIAFVVASVLLPAPVHIQVLVALVAALTGAIVEIFSTHVDDNLTIPLAVAASVSAVLAVL